PSMLTAISSGRPVAFCTASASSSERCHSTCALGGGVGAGCCGAGSCGATSGSISTDSQAASAIMGSRRSYGAVVERPAEVGTVMRTRLSLSLSLLLALGATACAADQSVRAEAGFADVAQAEPSAPPAASKAAVPTQLPFQ